MIWPRTLNTLFAILCDTWTAVISNYTKLVCRWYLSRPLSVILKVRPRIKNITCLAPGSSRNNTKLYETNISTIPHNSAAINGNNRANHDTIRSIKLLVTEWGTYALFYSREFQQVTSDKISSISRCSETLTSRESLKILQRASQQYFLISHWCIVAIIRRPFVHSDKTYLFKPAALP